MKGKDPVFSRLIGKKVKVKYLDEGCIRSIAGTVAGANDIYLVLNRPERGDPMFINHSVISRIIPVDDFEAESKVRDKNAKTEVGERIEYENGRKRRNF